MTYVRVCIVCCCCSSLFIFLFPIDQLVKRVFFSSSMQFCILAHRVKNGIFIEYFNDKSVNMIMSRPKFWCEKLKITLNHTNSHRIIQIFVKTLIFSMSPTFVSTLLEKREKFEQTIASRLHLFNQSLLSLTHFLLNIRARLLSTNCSMHVSHRMLMNHSK